jgi:hypothetical protein
MSKRQTFNDYKFLENGEAEFYIINKQGEQFTIKLDADDLERLIEFNRPWHVAWNKNSNGYYVGCCEYLIAVNGKPTYKIHYLHRWVFNYLEGTIIDHINHDMLDNRKCNLRITNIPDNSKHRNGKNKNNNSGYRNVCWLKNENKWAVQIMIDGKNTRVGKFTDLEEAAKFAEQMRQKYYGEFKGVG